MALPVHCLCSKYKSFRMVYLIWSAVVSGMRETKTVDIIQFYWFYFILLFYSQSDTHNNNTASRMVYKAIETSLYLHAFCQLVRHFKNINVAQLSKYQVRQLLRNPQSGTIKISFPIKGPFCTANTSQVDNKKIFRKIIFGLSTSNTKRRTRICVQHTVTEVQCSENII